MHVTGWRCRPTWALSRRFTALGRIRALTGRGHYLLAACGRLWSQVVGQGLGDVPLIPELRFVP
jgi:hypothetical protein